MPLDIYKEIKILLPKQQKIKTDYKGLIGTPERINKNDNDNSIERAKTLDKVQFCRYSELSKKIKNEKELLNQLQKINTAADYVILILNLSQQIYEISAAVNNDCANSNIYTEKTTNELTNKYKPKLNELYDVANDLFLEKQKLTKHKFSDMNSFFSYINKNDNDLKKYQLDYELFFRVQNVLRWEENYTASRNNNYFDNLKSLISSAKFIVKEELSYYFTSDKYLNNPDGRTLFVVPELVYNKLDFCYGGISNDTVRGFVNVQEEQRVFGELITQMKEIRSFVILQLRTTIKGSKTEKRHKNLQKSIFSKLIDDYLDSNTVENNIQKASKMIAMKRLAKNHFLDAVFSDFLLFMKDNENFVIPDIQITYFFAYAISIGNESTKGAVYDFSRLIKFWAKKNSLQSGANLSVGNMNSGMGKYNATKLMPQLKTIVDKRKK